MDLPRRDPFVVRNRIPTLSQFLILFIVDYLVVCGAWTISENFIAFALIVLVVLGLLNSIMVISVQRARDQMLVTEFQNTLYSSALNVDSQFCLIVRKDGTIVYTDTGFRTMYPQFDNSRTRTVEEMLHTAAAGRHDVDATYALLGSGTAGQHMLTMRDGDGLANKMVLSISPIQRPADYLLIRGRSYVESRNA